MAEQPDLEQRIGKLEVKIDALIDILLSINKKQINAGESIDSNFTVLNNKIDALLKMADKEYDPPTPRGF